MSNIMRVRGTLIFFLLTVIMLAVSSCQHDPANAPTPTPPDPKPAPPNTGDPQELVLPQKEIRAVWLATAYGLDWPMDKVGESAQKQLYIEYLDIFEELHFNTIFLQVRSMGDAFYNSKYEPWSKVITGTRGQDPGWDVLGFMLDEAHKRGFSVHAWVNPFRIDTSGNPPPLHPSIKPEWVVQQGTWQIYNPAIPEARQRVADIVAEIITKYDFDGLHIDDYFYPDANTAGAKPDDADAYQKYGVGYATVEDFRRSNVDKAVKAIFDAVRKHRPEIPFSISPAASYNYNRNTLYADVYKWAKEGWMDALIPQLYQEIGNKYNDYQLNLKTWAQYRYSTSLIIGHGLYKFGDPKAPAAFQSTDELVRQFDLARKDKRVVGNAQYRAQNLVDNKLNIQQTFKLLYPTPSIRPVLGKVIGSAPAIPNNVKLSNSLLSWEGDAAYYAVYYQPNGSKELTIATITKGKSFDVGSKRGTYYVSALSSNDFESKLSNGVKF